MSEIPMYPNGDCPCGEHATPWQCCLDQAIEISRLRGALEAAERKLGQIRIILENYSNDEHFSAWHAVGAIEELEP